MWHSAQYRGDELIVLGHDPRRNDCMLVKLSGLPMNEQQELRRIASSRSAQENSHLIPLLQRMQSPNGSDWFTYLANKMSQRNSPVFTLPIKEVQDSLDDDQKAIFKGYGKGRRNQFLDREDMSREFSGKEIEQDDLAAMKTLERSGDPVEQPLPHLDKGARSNSVEIKMDMLIETMADESRRTQQLLTTMIGLMAGDQSLPKKTRKATAKPKTQRVKHSVSVDGVEHEAE